jgi:hypothetical protein
MNNIFYWGCWKRAGHFLFYPGGQHVRDFECERLSIPSPYQLDGTVLFLPQPEKVGDGALTYLPGPNCTILAWWGSPWDKRGKSNSAIIIKGHITTDIWDQFNERFPEIAPDIPRPGVRG